LLRRKSANPSRLFYKEIAHGSLDDVVEDAKVLTSFNFLEAAFMSHEPGAENSSGVPQERGSGLSLAMLDDGRKPLAKDQPLMPSSSICSAQNPPVLGNSSGVPAVDLIPDAQNGPVGTRTQSKLSSDSELHRVSQ
jgi:hypothetical protein